MPVSYRFEPFLVKIAPAREEKQRASRFIFAGPVEPADRMAIGRVPKALARAGGYDAPVNSSFDADLRAQLANTGLSSLVTFW